MRASSSSQIVEILTWNIQAGLGVDGRVDLARIADVAHRFVDADIICFQEVSRWMGVFDASPTDDQAKVLAENFPAHVPFFGPVMERIQPSGKREQFGNLVLCRLPVSACSHHLLPRPASPGIHHMRRQATELVVHTENRRLSIVSTHLEYFSEMQRRAQVARLLELHQERCKNAQHPPKESGFGPYAHPPGPGSSIMCGDFNFKVQDPEYALITSSAHAEALRLMDGWPAVHGERQHDPTCGVFDTKQWPEGPHCRDFFFVSEDLMSGIRNVRVDGATAASDHQPVSLSIDL